MICLICGNTIKEDADRCPCCGARVESEEEESAYLDFPEISMMEETCSQIKTIVLRERTGQVFEITEYPAVLGRSSKCDYTIRGNLAIGRRHLQIDRTGNRIFLKDLGSVNHTYDKDGQVSSQVELVESKIIQMADEVFVFRKEYI